jgi:hypothetical protein
VSFTSELQEMGFELVQANRGAERFSARANAYLVLWVHTSPDGSAVFSWEFALGQYLKDKGFSVSVQDELSLMVFPGRDIRGPAEAAWVTEQIAAAEAELASIDLLAAR